METRSGHFNLGRSARVAAAPYFVSSQFDQSITTAMTFHDEVDIEEMDWNDELQAFTYQYVELTGERVEGSRAQATDVVLVYRLTLGPLG